MGAAKELSGDQALALRYGEVNIAEVSIVGLIGQACETMHDAFMQLNRYVPLVVDVDTGGGDRFRLERVAGGTWVVDSRREALDFPELSESAFSQLVRGPRRLGVLNLLKAVEFTHAAPAWKAEYDRVFAAPVTFGAAHNAMLIDETWMERRVAMLPRYVFGVLTERADAMLADMEETRSVRGRVERLLIGTLHTGEASMAGVADKLGMSRQTLFRRLKEEGVTFEEVLDALRRRLALQYLAGRKASVSEIAYLVGFSDPAAFSRAVKRWTGKSPRDLRG
jgi:AraC-like DNA-binding protein